MNDGVGVSSFLIGDLEADRRLRPGKRASTEFKARTRRFALDVIRFVLRLPRTDVSRHIGGQLLRSGTSQASNYRASCRARSRADFIAKMGIVEEELDETLLWLDLLLASGERVLTDDVKRLATEADELLAMTVQSIRTARGGSR